MSQSPKKKKPTTTSKSISRKNVEVRTSVKDRFEEIVQQEEAMFKTVSVLSLLRDSLIRLLSLWWLHKHDGGTFSIHFSGDRKPHELVNRVGILSVPPDFLGLDDDDPDSRDRINLSLPSLFLEELERIAKAQDKALTVVMRESFHLELLLHKLKETEGQAYFTLASGKKIDIISGLTIYNYSPKELLRFDNADLYDDEFDEEGDFNHNESNEEVIQVSKNNRKIGGSV